MLPYVRQTKFAKFCNVFMFLPSNGKETWKIKCVTLEVIAHSFALQFAKNTLQNWQFRQKRRIKPELDNQFKIESEGLWPQLSLRRPGLNYWDLVFATEPRSLSSVLIFNVHFIL